MKTLEQFIAEAKEKSIAEAKAIAEANEEQVFAVVDENEVIMGVFNTQEEADKEVDNLKDNPVPVKVKKMKRSEVEA